MRHLTLTVVVALMLSSSGRHAKAGGDPTPPATRCRPDEIPPSSVVSRMLDAAPRPQDVKSPPEGWCGETAIQEALLFHGVYAPQSAINAAGRPAHPDLYSSEIPTALAEYSMDVEAWPAGAQKPDMRSFVAWIRRHIASDTPVICGVKINPTKHPEWSADHFVLAVGTVGDSILFNPSGGTSRVLRTETQLASVSEAGFGFESPQRRYYGLAVRDRLDRAKGSAFVRLHVESETKESLRVIVKCEGLRVGAKYVLVRNAAPTDRREPRTIARFTAESAVEGFRDDVTATEGASYSCRRE